MRRLVPCAFCAILSFVLPAAAVAQPAPIESGPNMFGTILVPVQRTPFEARWTRALRAGPGPIMAIVASARAATGTDRLALVNAAVNHAVTRRSDWKNWGVEDHWSSAAETMAKGGDCEDIAVAKLQALLALGVPADDLYLVIGRDLLVRGDHAILVVQSGKRFWVLDNQTDRIVAADEFGDFRPIFSLRAGQSWVHGYPPGTIVGQYARRTGTSGPVAPASAVSAREAMIAAQEAPIKPAAPARSPGAG